MCLGSKLRDKVDLKFFTATIFHLIIFHVVYLSSLGSYFSTLHWKILCLILVGKVKYFNNENSQSTVVGKTPDVNFAWTTWPTYRAPSFWYYQMLMPTNLLVF